MLVENWKISNDLNVLSESIGKKAGSLIKKNPDNINKSSQN